MLKYLRYFLSIVLILALLLAFTKPNEQDFLDQVVNDYGQIHGNDDLTRSDLERLGTTHYSSHLFASSYTYQFGAIDVQYIGLLGRIYYQGFEDKAGEKVSSESIDV